MSNFSTNLLKKIIPIAILTALGIVFLPDFLNCDSEQPLVESDFLLFESEEQFVQATISAFQNCLDAEEYPALAILVTSYSPEFIDYVFNEINPAAYAIDSISRNIRIIKNYHSNPTMYSDSSTSSNVYEDYYNEVSYIGQIPVRGEICNFTHGSISENRFVFRPRSFEELERRVQPKIIITNEEIFIGTTGGTYHACYAIEIDDSDEAVFSFPWDSLSIKLAEVHNLLSEAYPQSDFHKTTILVSENIRYQNIVETINTAQKAGFIELTLQTAPSSSINYAMRGRGTGANGGGSAQSADAAADVLSSISFAAYGTGTGGAFVGDLQSAASSGAGFVSGYSGESLIAGAGEGGVEMQVVHQAAQVTFSASASGDAIDLGYRDMSQIRRKINVIKMRVQSAYEGLLHSDPGVSGTITIQFSITPSGSVTGVSVSGELSSMHSAVRSAVSGLNFGPASEQTGNLLVTAPFSLIPPQ